MIKLFFIFVASLVLGGCTLPFLPQPKAALQVSSDPTASVYLNDNRTGQTTYFDDSLKPGDYTLKMSVDNDPSKTWQTPITLLAQLVTVVNRTFGDTPELSSYFVLQLEPLESKNAIELSVLSLPDNVIVKINGQPEGFSPVSVTDIEEGDHSITLTSPGYTDLNIKAQTKKGYKLIVSAGLARQPESLNSADAIASPSAQLEITPPATPSGRLTPSPRTSPTPTLRTTPATTPNNATGSASLTPPYVTIRTTPTGWLRVRSAPDSNAENEVARVNPGEKYKFVESNDAGWYKIEYKPNAQGWISGQYADLIR